MACAGLNGLNLNLDMAAVRLSLQLIQLTGVHWEVETAFGQWKGSLQLFRPNARKGRGQKIRHASGCVARGQSAVQSWPISSQLRRIRCGLLHLLGVKQGKA